MKGNSYRPDAQAFDCVVIQTIPRYKESGLSGDEWRISAKVTFYRNGVAHHEFSTRNVETGLMMAPGEWLKACDDGKAYFASEDAFCDQEGCDDTATHYYRRKDNWCSSCGKSQPFMFSQHNIRQFCEKHKIRGDCALDDADRNYEEVND